MSDTDTDTVDTIDTPEETTTPTPEPEKTFTAAEIDRIVERRLDRERAKYADYDKIRADAEELVALREADQTEIAKALERAEAAEKRIAAAEFDALRTKIAVTKGVPTSSLIGNTEEELVASADELIAWRDQNAAEQQPPPKAPPKRSPSTSSGLKSGATGNENTHSDPKAVAAEALRRLRSEG